jgi:hypothetical protein
MRKKEGRSSFSEESRIIRRGLLLNLENVTPMVDAAINTYLKAETGQRRFSGVVLVTKDGIPLVRRNSCRRGQFH